MDNPVLNNIIPPTIDGNVLDNSVLNDSTPVLPGVVSIELPQESNAQTTPNKSFKSKGSGQPMIKSNTNKNLLTSHFFETPIGVMSETKHYSSRATSVNEKQEYDKKHNYYSNPESTNYALDKIVDNYQPIVKTIQRQQEIANEVSGKFNSSKFLDGMKANAEFQKANEIDYKDTFLKLGLSKFQIQKSIPNVLKFKDTSPLDKLIISKLPKTTLVDNVMNELVKTKGNKYLMYKPAIERAVADVQAGKYNDALDYLGFSKTIELAIDDKIRLSPKLRIGYNTSENDVMNFPRNVDTLVDGPNEKYTTLYQDTFNTKERTDKLNAIAQIDSAMKELIELNYANSIKNNNYGENKLENAKTAWDKLANITNSILIPYVKSLNIKDMMHMISPASMITDEIYDLTTQDIDKAPNTGMALAAIINMGAIVSKYQVYSLFGINYRSAEAIGNYKPVSLSNTFNLNPNSLAIDVAESFGKYGALAPDLIGDVALNIARDIGAVSENLNSVFLNNNVKPDASEGTSYFSQAYYNKIREQRGSLYPTNEFDKNVVVPAEQMVASIASFVIEMYALSPIFKALAAPIGRAGIAMGGSELSLLKPAANTIWGEIAATGTNRIAMGLLSASKYAPEVLGGLAGGYIEGVTVGDETYNNIYKDLVVNQGYSEEDAHIQALKGRNIATGLNSALITASNAIQLGHVFKAGKQFLVKSEMKAITKELVDSGMSLEQAITEASIKTLKKYGNPESIKSIAKTLFLDGALEFNEESFLNTISQLIGESFTDAKRRNDNGSIKSTFDTLFSWDNLSQGIWGFIGGSGTNIVMNGINGGKVKMQKLNDKGERIYLDDNNNETTEFTFNPKLEEVNYNGWNIERITARQTADGIMMNFANDNFVMNKLSKELETLANQEGSTDRTAMMEHIKNEIFNIGLLRSVETGLSPYVKMQYEQIANLTPQQAVALGLAVNEKDTSYKTRANEAIAKYESIENIFKEFETKFGKNSSFFDGLAHTKAKLKTFEYLKQNELDLLQREIDGKRKEVDKLKRRRKLDGVELQPLFDLYEKEHTLKNELIELEQEVKLLSDRKANNTSPLHDPATGTIEDRLKVVNDRIKDLSDEIDSINEKIKTTREEIIDKTIVTYNGKSTTYGQMYNEIESLVKNINTKVEKENKLRNDIKSLETEIEQKIEEVKLKEEQFNSDIELAEDSNKKEAIRIKKKSTLKLLEIETKNKVEKLEQLKGNNKTLISEINDGNKELISLQSEFKKQNTKLEHTNDTISKWQSELRKEVVGYSELLSRKAKGEASINTARGVFDNIHKLSKSAYNKKQIDSLFKEVDNHRMAKLHAIMALNIAIETGTISSEVLSKDRLANLITDLNWEDFSNASKTKQGLYAQQVKHYIRLLKRLKSKMILIHGPIAIKMLEDKLNNIKDITGDNIFDNYKKLVNELLDGIKAEVELRAKQIKDAKTNANNQIDLINGNTLDLGLSNAIDEIIKNDYNFTPQGWLKLLNKLREISKSNLDEFKEFKTKYEKSILALLEKAKPNLSFMLYHDIIYTFSEEFQNENKKYEYSDIKTFIVSLQKVEPSILINSMLSTILTDAIQPLLIFEEERRVLLQNPEANEAEIDIIEDEEIRIFDGLLEDIQKYISDQTLYLSTLLVADENYIVNDLIDKSTIIAYVDELQKLREYINPIIDSFLNEIDFNDNTEAKSKMLDEAKTKIDFTFNELASLFELNNKLKETLKSEESTDVEEESEQIKQFGYILANGSLTQVNDNYINERLNSDTLDKAFYNSLSESEMEIALELKAAINETIGFEEQLAKLTDIYNKYEKSLNIEKVLLDLLLFRKGEYIEPIVKVEQVTNAETTIKLTKTLTVETPIFDIDNDRRVIELTEAGIDLFNQFLSIEDKVVLENVTIGKTEYIRIKGTDFKLPSIASLENKLKALRSAKNTYKLSKAIQKDIDTLAKRLGDMNRVEVAAILIQRYEELVNTLKDLTIALQTNNLEVNNTFDNQMILTETSFDNYVTNETVTISEVIGETIEEIFDIESTSKNKVNVFVKGRGVETAIGINNTKSLALAIPEDSMFIQSDILGHDIGSEYINMQDVIEATFRKFNSDDVLDILDTIERLLNSTDKVNSLEYEKLKDLFRVEFNKKSKVEDSYFKLNLKENTYTLNLIKLTGYQTLQFKLKNGKLEITDITVKDQLKTVTINETIDIFKTRKPTITNNPSINYLKNVGKYIVPKCKVYKVGNQFRYLMPRPIANAVAKSETFTEYGKQKSYNLKRLEIKGSITIEAGAFGVSNKVPISLPIGDHLQGVEIKAKLTLDEVSTILTDMLANPQGQVIWSSMNSGVTTFVNSHPDLFIDFTTELHDTLKSLFDNMSKDDLNKLLIEHDPLLSKLSEEKQIEFLDNIWKNNTNNNQNNIDTKSVLFDMLLLQYNNYYLNASKWLSRRDIEMRLLNDLKAKAKTEKKIIIITSSEQFVNNDTVDLFLVYEDATKLKEVRNKTYTFNDGSTNEVFKSDAAFEEFSNKRSGYKNQKYFVLDTYISDLINPLIIPVTTTANNIQPELVEIKPTETQIQTEIEFFAEARTFIVSPKDKEYIQDLVDEFRNNDDLTLDKLQEILTNKFVNPDLVMKIMDYFDNDIEFNADEIKYQLLQYKDINLETYNNLVNYIEQKLGVSFNKVSLGKSVYGYNKNNELYLNTDMISADTPIHEALGHPVISYIKDNNIKLYNNLSNWIKDNLNKGDKNGIVTLYNKIETASKFNNLKLSEENLIEEVMVNYLSRLLTNKALNAINSDIQEYSNTFDELIQGYINDENLDFKLISSNVNISQLANILFHNQNISRILDTIIKSQKELINNDTNLMATNSTSYDYPDNIKSIYNFKQYQFKNNGWSSPLDQLTKQTLNKALVRLSNETEKYTLRESSSVKNSYMIQLNGRDLKPNPTKLQATVPINTIIKEGITELFESNPELANAVYESLGFKSKADVILPIGTSGSGKSTFIKSLPQENLVVIEPDAMRVEFTGDINDKSKDKEIYVEAANRAIQAIKQGKQVVFDTTNLTKDKRLPFIEAIKKVIPDANIQYKLMKLNPELAKQRIKAQLERGENRAAVSDETIDRHAASYKQMLEDIKSEPISNFEITPQQKQQAQQLYSQYLDTIFPDSKVKDIVYHGGKTNKDSFKRFVDKTKYKDRNPNSILGFFFSSSRNTVAGQYAEKDYDAIKEHLTGDAETDAFIRRSAPLKKGSVSEELLNIKNPYIIQAEEWENETWVDKLNILTEKDKDDDWVSDYKWTVDAYEKVKNHLQSLGYDGLYINSNKELFNKTGIVDYITVQKVVFEPEQIHILGSKADIQGFKEFTQGKQFQKLTIEEKAKTIEQVTREHRSIAALKDLSAKLAHRIGGKVQFENNPNADWKGYNQGMTSVLNEVYMTPDTPFHEILAHPIIRAIKNRTTHYKTGETAEFHGYGEPYRVTIEKIYEDTLEADIIDEKGSKQKVDLFELSKTQNTLLYQSLLKELETGRGKEVLEQVKRDYNRKKPLREKPNPNDSDYLPEENQYEPRYYSEQEYLDDLELWKQERDDVNNKYTLEEQQEEAIVTLLGLMAADKLDAKKDASLISKLKELWKQISDFVKSLLRQDSIKIDELPITTTLNDLAEIMAYGNNKIILPGYKIEYSTPLGNKYDTLEEVNQEIRGLADADVEVDLSGVKVDTIQKKAKDITEVPLEFDMTKSEFEEPFIIKKDGNRWIAINGWDDYQKVTELSEKEVLQYYNNYRIGDNLNNFIEKNKEYEQSREIIEQWKKENNIQYDPEEVYSRGQEFYHIHNAYSRNNVDTELWIQNLLETIQDKAKIGAKIEMSFATAPKGKVGKGLQHHNKKTKQTVYITSYPKSEDIEFVSQIDNYTSSFTDLTVDMIKAFTNQKNERVGITLTKSVPLKNLHTIQPNLATAIDNVAHHNEIVIGLTPSNFRINYEEEVPYHLKKLIDNFNKILDDKYGKLVKPDIKREGSKIETYGPSDDGSYMYVVRDSNNEVITDFETYQEAENYVRQNITKQPTQTRENTTSIESVKTHFGGDRNNAELLTDELKKEIDVLKSLEKLAINKPDDWSINNAIKKKKSRINELNETIDKLRGKKEYTSQALSNLKVAALKEVARKYPRSLIISRVVPINPNMVDNSEIQYSKVGPKQDIQGFKNFVNNDNINTTIINNITDSQIKQELQEVYIKQDDNLLQIYLKVNPTANEAFTESQNKLYPNRSLNIMFKNLNNISDEDTRFRC